MPCVRLRNLINSRSMIDSFGIKKKLFGFESLNLCFGFKRVSYVSNTTDFNFYISFELMIF